MLLSIDTSSGTTVAVVGEGVRVFRSEHDTRRHAEVVGDLIAECLAEAGVRSTDIEGVAVGMGPGPFTGLRVGIAAAIAFSVGRGIPLYRVVSHDAIAFEHYRTGGTGPLLVVSDARRREVYWSTYSGVEDGGIPCRVDGPALCPPAELGQRVPAWGDYPGEGELSAPVAADALAELALRMREHRRDFCGPEPLYLRAADAKVPTGPKRVS